MMISITMPLAADLRLFLNYIDSEGYKMTKDEFKKLCWQLFKEYGFKKQKKDFVNDGCSNVYCTVDLQKSNYGEAFYINCWFGIKDDHFNDNGPLHASDFFNRVQVTSVSMHNNAGNCFETQMILYEDYNVEQMTRYIKAAFEDWVMPPLQIGGEYVIEHQEKYVFLKRDRDATIKALLK